MVLITDKADAPSLLKALSSAYRGRVAFGALRAPSALTGKQQAAAEEAVAALGAAAQGRALPAVVMVCNGDVRGAEAYAGVLKSEALQRALNKYAAGKLCSSKFVVDEGTDLNGLSVGQLKAVISARGIECKGCYEKGDYVRALREALTGGKKGKEEL